MGSLKGRSEHWTLSQIIQLHLAVDTWRILMQSDSAFSWITLVLICICRCLFFTECRLRYLPAQVSPPSLTLLTRGRLSLSLPTESSSHFSPVCIVLVLFTAMVQSPRLWDLCLAFCEFQFLLLMRTLCCWVCLFALEISEKFIDGFWWSFPGCVLGMAHRGRG